MLPKFETISSLPRKLEFVRDLEAFDGPILSEYRAADFGAVYVEKWCACDQDVSRFLLTRTDHRSLAEYLAGRITLWDLLILKGDGVGFLVDRRGSNLVALSIAPIERLPEQYLPDQAAYHDQSLRPDWEFVPQSFLFDAGWNGKRLADIERRFLNVAGFAYFTEPETNRSLPVGILGYNYDRGFPIASAFSRIRVTVPREERSRSVGVSANSPGILTLEAPAAIAARVAAALRALPDSIKAYQELHTWSRIKPKDAAERMPEVEIAHRDLARLCGILAVDERPLIPAGQAGDPLAILTAGKLVAAYWRQLWRLLSGDDGAEFISVDAGQAAPDTTVMLGDDDEEGDDE
jgi:hypothetical protein